MKKIKIVFFLTLLFIALIFNTTYATGIDDIISGADNFMDAQKDYEFTKINNAGVIGISDFVFNILITIGSVVVLFAIVFIGIKFMISSVEEQAKIKEALVPFVIGCVVIFGAVGIWKLATGILKDATSTSKIIEVQNSFIQKV